MSGSPEAEDLANGTSQSSNNRTYSQIAATHIRELSDIDRQIPQLLYKSAASISLLTNRPVSASDSPPDPSSRTQTIHDTSYDLFLLINQIRGLLHKQVDELQAEKVIPAEAARFLPPPKLRDDEEQSRALEEQEKQSKITNGGMGSLTVAELNARAGVRQQGDDEEFKRLQAILKQLQKKADGEGDETTMES